VKADLIETGKIAIGVAGRSRPSSRAGGPAVEGPADPGWRPRLDPVRQPIHTSRSMG